MTTTQIQRALILGTSNTFLLVVTVDEAELGAGIEVKGRGPEVEICRPETYTTNGVAYPVLGIIVDSEPELWCSEVEAGRCLPPSSKTEGVGKSVPRDRGTRIGNVVDVNYRFCDLVSQRDREGKEEERKEAKREKRRARKAKMKS